MSVEPRPVNGPPASKPGTANGGADQRHRASDDRELAPIPAVQPQLPGCDFHLSFDHQSGRLQIELRTPDGRVLRTIPSSTALSVKTDRQHD